MTILSSESELIAFGDRVQSVMEEANKRYRTWGVFLFMSDPWVEDVNRELLALAGPTVYLQGEAARLCLDYVSRSQVKDPNAGLKVLAGLLFHSPVIIFKGVSSIVESETERKRLAQSRRAFGACEQILKSYDLCRTTGEEQCVFVFAGWYVMVSQYGRTATSNAKVRLDHRVIPE